MACIFLSGCNFTTLFSSGNKPTPTYYTNNLISTINKNDTPITTLTSMNFYKTAQLEDDQIFTIYQFINTLSVDNFIVDGTPENISTDNPVFKIILEFDDSGKYIINVYNSEIASIHPWDGKYPMDYIDMSSLPPALNLYDICNNFIGI